MGENGCVNWKFEKKGQIIVPKEGVDEEQIMNDALEAGADDVIDRDDVWEILTAMTDVYAVSDQLTQKGYQFEEVKIARIPQTLTKVEGKVAEQVLKLVEAFDDSDDVQDVYADYDIDFSQIPDED